MPKLSDNLRKLATELREQAVEERKNMVVKCAQILTAARGLEQLKEILKGAR